MFIRDRFNNLRNSSKDVEKFQKIEEGKPGSPCPRKFLALSDEYGTQGVCTASRLFQKNKIEEKGISDQITDKTCLCMGLAATAVINYGIETRESKGVSICPGPNMAYFNPVTYTPPTLPTTSSMYISVVAIL